MNDRTSKFLQYMKKDRVSIDALGSIVDDIFAVAMTILAFSVVVPSIGQVTTMGLSNYISQFESQLSLLIVCFIILGNNWITERELLSSVDKTDKKLTFITLILLMGVTTYPVFLNLVNTLGNEFPIFTEYYHLNKLFVAILFLIQWMYISSNQLHFKKSWSIRNIKHNIQLFHKDLTIKTRAFKIFYYPIIVIIAIIISFWYPGPSRYIYVLLLLKPVLTKYNERYYIKKMKEKTNNNTLISNISDTVKNIPNEDKDSLKEISKNFNDLDNITIEENRNNLIDIIINQHPEIRENISNFEAFKKENDYFDSDDKIEYYVKFRAIIEYYKNDDSKR